MPCPSLLLCVSLVPAFGWSASSSDHFDPCSYRKEDVLVRDVVVIGGGASGTYGAIALKDMGRSVAVVEKEPQFGGHVNTGYANDSITQNFFGRFDIPLIPLGAPSGEIIADFRTGQNVSTASRQIDLATYGRLTNRYYPEPAIGLQLPNPVPADLLLSFRNFIHKYSLEDVAYTIWSYTSPANNLLDQLALYGIFGCNAASTPLLGGHGSDVTTRNNSELFGKAEEELAESALLRSRVVASKRSTSGVSLVVETSTTKKLIRASQVLFSAPIVLDNLNPFDLDGRERHLFSQIYYTAWFTALVTDTGLRPGFVYENAANDSLFNIPLEPYTFRIGATRSNDTFYAFYGAMTDLPEDQVKVRIADSIRALSGNSTTPRFLAYASHTPFKQQVSAQAVADGFYDQLNALQGYRRMFYTGNALDVSGSSSLFNFTQQLLPKIDEAVEANKPAPGLEKCKHR
ncbi:MAG: hypothetical protein Q9219_007245 [cf. Caloplaca sp. 3 TL-2023]